MELKNPYLLKGSQSFWKTAVAQKNFVEIELENKNINFGKYSKITAYGSCFAQYLVYELKSKTRKFKDYEKSPPKIPLNQRIHFGYDTFSSRTGNIYTSSHLLQEINFSLNIAKKNWDKLNIFEKDGRFFDGYRPNIWPEGTNSKNIIINDRQIHYEAFKNSLIDCDLFIFTFGLIENWRSAQNELILPLVPGVKFGEYDEKLYCWSRETYEDVCKNIKLAIKKIRNMNPKTEFLFTLSPVPLTATFSEDHILIANNISKSTIRVALNNIVDEDSKINYFPSYEIITNPAARSQFFEANLRNVSKFGVSTVMKKMLNFDSPELSEILCDEDEIDS